MNVTATNFDAIIGSKLNVPFSINPVTIARTATKAQITIQLFF